MDRMDFLEVLEACLLYFDGLSYAAIKSNGLKDQNIKRGIKIVVKLKEQAKSQGERLVLYYCKNLWKKSRPNLKGVP